MAMELTATPRAKTFEEFLEFVRRGEAEIIRDWSSPLACGCLEMFL